MYNLQTSKDLYYIMKKFMATKTGVIEEHETNSNDSEEFEKADQYSNKNVIFTKEGTINKHCNVE